MNAKRFFPWLFGTFVLVFASMTYFQFMYLCGFPDGHRTELDLARLKLFSVFILISIAISGFSFYLGWLKSREKESENKRMTVTVLFFCLLVMVIFSINYFFSLYLEHGAGG